MKLVLPSRLGARLALALAGAFSFAFLELHAAFFLAGSVLGSYFKAAGLALGFLLLSSLGLQACLRSRRFLLQFCRWGEVEEAGAAGPEGRDRRDLLRAAKQFFFQGDYSRAQDVLGRYLALRPADNTARLNLAWSLAAAGKLPEAREQLAIAGDPRCQDALIDPARSSFGRWKRAFWPKEAAFSQSGALMPLAALAAMILSLALAVAELNYAAKSSDRLLQAPSLRYLLLELARERGNFGASQFLAEESGSFIFHYHDPALLSQVRPMAEEALAANLRFYVLPEGQFQSSKIKVFLMDSKEEYLRRSPLHKSWEAGCTLDELQEIYVYRPAPRQWAWFENTLAHEISHVCYRKVLPGIDQESWLNEGLASYIGHQFMLERLRFAGPAWLREHVFKGVARQALPFEDFLAGNPQQYQDRAKISQFYDQGFSMAYVLINYYGKESFIQFLHHYSRSRDLVQGLKRAYPTIQSLADLRGVWLLFMEEGQQAGN